MAFITLENSKIHYQALSPKVNANKNTLVIFLHEALGSIEQWKNFPQQLCDQLGLNGIVYERQGYGQSSALISLKNDNNTTLVGINKDWYNIGKDEYDLPNARNNTYLREYAWLELPLLLNKLLKKGQKAILVGHSDGGSIALLYADKYPEKVESVVTMAAHVINEDITKAGILPAINAYKKGKLKGLEKYHFDKTDTLFWAWAHTWLSKSFSNWNICSDIANLQCEGLIIQGVIDQYGTEEQVDLILASFKNKRSEKLMIENCGHAPHLEKRNEVISAISKFIKEKWNNK